jgi:hypothetical protein
MTSTHRIYLGVAAIALAVALSGPSTSSRAEQSAVAIDSNDIGGIVTGPKGPEAGVWVIAETHDLPTRFARMVVTDNQGRYVLPDLPKAKYKVWVRGYGLLDSPKVDGEPGQHINLKAVPAPNAAAAAHYYPAIYWFAMLKIPDKGQFPGTGDKGNGIATREKTQFHWLNDLKSNGCVGCHQLGNEATRTIPKTLGQFKTSTDAWIRRIQSGQASTTMVRDMGWFGPEKIAGLFGDWTDRVAAGQLPSSKPERPQGIERNVVVTIWDWGGPKMYLHDEISTDKRKPTINAYGKLYGAPELSTDMIPILDPRTSTATAVKMPVRDPKTPSTAKDPIFAPSPYWEKEAIWDSQTSTHNPMMDEAGRVWFTSRIRPAANPSFCKKGSDHPSAKLTSLTRSGRQLSMFDPKTQKFTLVNTCFGTHHLVFAEDANNTLWTSGERNGVGWLNTRMFLKTHDEVKSQGWTAVILDTNGNGKRDEGYVGPRDKVDPTKDKRVIAPFYGVAVSPVDGSVWGSIRRFPGDVVRLVPGSNPPATALAEIFELPWNDPKAPVHGYGPRGMDIDRNGVVWTPLASGHLASFDRRKCKGPLNGPKATGRHCPEGWTLYPFPGPQFDSLKGVSGSAESAYYVWVDQYNTSGLGNNVPVATGNENEGLLALVNGKFITLRVPYPMGFYAKGLDGRIDDPKAGWKGRGLWTATGNRTPFHMEGGKGNKPIVVHFQIRPNPLAH